MEETLDTTWTSGGPDCPTSVGLTLIARSPTGSLSPSSFGISLNIITLIDGKDRQQTMILDKYHGLLIDYTQSVRLGVRGRALLRHSSTFSH